MRAHAVVCGLIEVLIQGYARAVATLRGFITGLHGATVWPSGPVSSLPGTWLALSIRDLHKHRRPLVLEISQHLSNLLLVACVGSGQCTAAVAAWLLTNADKLLGSYELSMSGRLFGSSNDSYAL